MTSSTSLLRNQEQLFTFGIITPVKWIAKKRLILRMIQWSNESQQRTRISINLQYNYPKTSRASLDQRLYIGKTSEDKSMKAQHLPSLGANQVYLRNLPLITMAWFDKCVIGPKACRESWNPFVSNSEPCQHDIYPKWLYHSMPTK